MLSGAWAGGEDALDNPNGPPEAGGAGSPRLSDPSNGVYSFRAASGPVIRLSSGKVEATIASEAARPPSTAAQ